jgi:hypothetical protein
MRRLYPFIFTATVFFSGFHPIAVRADLFGGDVAVLTQILSNAIQQLSTLQQMVHLANGDSELLRQVNRDIGRALTEIYAIQDIVRETTSIGKTQDPAELLRRLRRIYGQLPKFGNIAGFEFVDQVSGTAFGVDHDTHVHAQKIDVAAVALQNQIRTASPGRAQQLNAQSQTTILHSLAQIERSNATLVRLLATDLAARNERQKSKAEDFNETYRSMTTSHAGDNIDLTLIGLN